MNDIIRDIALQTGRLIKGSSADTQSFKTNIKDFVTLTDIHCQTHIRESLNLEFPNVAVVGEEDDTEIQQFAYAPDFTGFIIDPLDGTFNFRHGLQESCVSIGYIENGEPMLGVAYDPYKNELWEAQAGQGAFLNGERIHIGSHTSIEGAAIAFNNNYDDAQMAKTIKRHLALYEQTGFMPWTTCLGSGVLTMSWVACGRLDGFHHNGLKPWDNAAAFLIIREAGGLVLTLQGEHARFTDPGIVAGNEKLVTAVLAEFKRMDPNLLV